MTLSRLSVLAWRNLWRNRRRTLLTLTSIAFGVFLAVLFTALQDRNWADMIDLAARLGGGHVTVQHAEYLDKPTLDRTVRVDASLLALPERDERVARVTTRIVGQTMLATAGKSQGAGFIAFDPASEDLETFSITDAIDEGRSFESADGQGIILGWRLAENLGLRLGKKVVYTMTDKEGEIVNGLARLEGIIRTGTDTADGFMALFPLNAVRRQLGYDPDEVNQVAVFITDSRRSAKVAAAILAGLGEEATAVAWHESQPGLAAFIALKVGGARFMELLIALLVAAGIFNTLFMSVTERMREFGIMMAIGFTPLDLFLMVMIESLWLGLVGLVAAAVFTAGPNINLARTGRVYSAIIGDTGTEIAGVGLSPILKVGIFPENAILIAVAALVATMLAGIYPAIRAGRVVPVETIRLV
jgi:ABC-type lipoprotein release transport system permease subunit